uniref:CCDC92 domain-containing protein n=1 Tax=Caenorhabditis tropicalis TaxID=1561998 RepID=A0A1I7V345_9PELO
MKSQQIAATDNHVTEMKLVTESKFRQLQHLEALLTAECSEIERIRNEQKIIGTGLTGNSTFHLNLENSGSKQRIGQEQDAFGSNNSNLSSHRRSENVRASLRKHYENLERYAGQKVATVAPHNN